MKEKSNQFISDHPAIVYTIVFILSLFIGSGLMSLRGIVNPEPGEWCLVTTLDRSGGYFGSEGPGRDEYRILETENGIHVYQPCKKI